MTLEDLEVEMAEINRQIGAIKAQLDPLYARKKRVQAILNGPRVLAVAHYWQYGSRDEEVCDTIEQAFGYLDSGADYGYFTPDGVTVGGAPVGRPEGMPE